MGKAPLFVLLGCAGLGCASGNATFKLSAATAAPYAAKLIAVYPVALRYDAPAYRSYELAMEEVQVALDTCHFMVLGPTEFQVFNWESDALYASTNLAGKLTPLGLSPGNAAALRGWVEKRETQSAKEAYDKNGKAKGRARSVDVSYVIHLEFVAPDATEPLMEGQVEIAADPFADHPESDDAPEVRQALHALTRQLFGKLGDRLKTSDAACTLPFDADWVPWDEERLALPSRRALRDELAAQDAVAVESSRLLRLAYFEPDLPPERRTAMLAFSPGLFVRQVPSKLQASGLSAGDLVTMVEDEPVVGPQTLLRWETVKGAGAPLSLKALRDGQIVPLRLTVPKR